MNIIDYKLMHNFVKNILVAVNVPERDADIVTDSLVDADLKGISSHGVMRLPIYIERIKAGSLKPKTSPTVEKDGRNILLLNGHNGLGQVLGVEAMQEAIKKAKEHSIGLVGVKNSHHFGAAAYFSELALESDMIGISLSNTTPLMPAIGGASPVVGNNPISFAVPTQNEIPISFDMACSVVAMGKILNAQKKGSDIPLGWGVDQRGNPTIKPQDVLNGGFISPVGGAKGFGLALMVDILSGVLLGGAYGAGVKSIYQDIQKPNSCGHMFIAINISDFIPINMFKEHVDQMIRAIKNSKKSEGITEIYMPGEIEYNYKEKNKINGLKIPKIIVNELNEIAGSLDVSAIDAC